MTSERAKTSKSPLGFGKEICQRVYRLLYSKVLGVLLFLAMAILALIGTLVMQAPMSKYLDRAAYQEWLPNAQEKYGAFTKVFDFLGFFSLWSSPLFLAVIILLTLSIIACTTHRLPVLWKKTMQPRIRVSRRFFAHAQYRANFPLEMPLTQTRDSLAKVLKQHRLHLVSDPQAPESIYADRNRFAPLGTVVAHASFVIILAAFAISAFAGFEESLELPIGVETQVGNDSNLQVTAVSFQDSYDEQGRPTDYVSELKVSRAGKTLGEQEVRVNTPLVVEGYRFHQASYGLAATITVKDANQKQVGTYAVPLKWTSSDGLNAVGRLDLPKLDREIIVATPASGERNSNIAAGSALIEVYEISTDKQLQMSLVDQGKSAQIGGLEISFDRESQYTGIIVRKDPGTIWMWIGCGLLILGMIMTFGFRHRRYWLLLDYPSENQPEKSLEASPETKTETQSESQTEARTETLPVKNRPGLAEAVDTPAEKARLYFAAVDEPDSILDREFRQIAQDLAQACKGQTQNH